MAWQAAPWSAVRMQLVREASDQWRWMGGLSLFALAIVLSMSSRDPSRGISPAVAALAVVPPLACAWMPASVVDDASSGFLRLVSTQPLPRGAYAALRILACALLSIAVVAPVALALALWSGRIPDPAAAAGALVLVALWSASVSVLFGLLGRGPTFATAAWVVVAALNAFSTLRVWSRLDLDDMLDRMRHAFPGPLVEEALTRGHDPWTYGALVLLLAQTLLALAAAVAYAGVWRAGEDAGRSTRVKLGAALAAALILPFLMPGSLEVRT